MTARVDIATAYLPPGDAIVRDPKTGRRMWRCQECGAWARPTARASWHKSLAAKHAKHHHHVEQLALNEKARSGRVGLRDFLPDHLVTWLIVDTDVPVNHVGTWGALGFDGLFRADDLDDMAERVADAEPNKRAPQPPDTTVFAPIAWQVANSLRHAARALRLAQSSGIAWHLAWEQTIEGPP